MFDSEKLISATEGSIKQFVVLVRHFFQRLFLNDIVSFEEQMKAKVVVAIVFIAVFCAHLSNVLLFKYLFMPDKGSSWLEKNYFISFVMVIMGFISVLEWEVIFPDARDYFNLTPLPLKLRNIFAAKFTSLCLFIGMFILGSNAVSAFIFWLYLARWKSSSPIFGLRLVFSHLASVSVAGFSVFFFIALIIGILMLLLGYRLFAAVSVFIRALFMIGFVFVMFFFVSESLTASHSLTFFAALKENNSHLIYFFPPMWFTGLYEILLGNHDPVFANLALISLLAVITAVTSFFFIGLETYRRYLRKMHEARKKTPSFLKLKSFSQGLFNTLFLKNPVQRAIFYFFGKTLKESMPHKMRLVSYVVFPLGAILILLFTKLGTHEFFFRINVPLLTIPLVMHLFLLIGLRSVINIPLALEANWIFRLTEKKIKKDYFLGLRKGIFFFTLLPMYAFFFAVYTYLWGLESAFLHSIYGLIIGVVTMEVLFFSYRKIPFACSYLPGKSRIQFLWLVFVFGFIFYLSFFSFIEFNLFKNPSWFLIFFAIMALAVVGIEIFQRHFLLEKLKILYEETPEPVMVTLVGYEPL